ncbi:MAG: hypothetical protein KKD28_06450 [Chloroflexi bacterium]|nr:hypothetical protein [Chloroflexota bacterium]
MLNQFTGLLWFLLTLAPLIALQRVLHREIQASLYIASGGNAQLTMAIFSLLFLPGVALHEFSHFIIARLLFVRTRGFSIIPKMMPQGYLRMGYVEVAETDIVRDSLIGAAPLILGNLAVAYIAIDRLHLIPLWDVLRNGQMNLFWLGVSLLPKVPDFALWFYLTFAISSTMLPSQSDRHAWLPLGFSVAALFALAIFAGAGSWMILNLAPPLNAFLRSVATLLGLSAAVHGILIPPVMLLHKLLARWLGWDVG